MKRTMPVSLPRVKAFSREWEAVTGLNWYSARLNWVPLRVRIADLTATQPSVRLKGLKSCDPEQRINVVRFEDRLYIRDGHHRTMRRVLMGRKTIDAIVVQEKTDGKHN